MNREIILVYDDQLPVGSANATRIASFAHMFRAIGYSVLMLGVNYRGLPQTEGFYEGIPYELLTFKEMHYTGLKSPLRRKYLKRHLEAWLDTRRQKNDVEAIFYSSRNGLASFFLSYARTTGVPVLYNHVEWHLLSMFSGKFGIFSFFQNRFELRFVLNRIHNIVAISSFLQHYYDRKNCHTIRIPTIINLDNYPADEAWPDNEKLVLAYAGKPGKKDAILNVVSAIRMLESEGERVEFRLYGITEQEILAMGGLSQTDKALVGKQVLCKGRIPYEQVQSELKKADFTILLRKNWRNANAGFPTKIGESMASSVPVIANLTSDIGLYLHDGVEGLVCADETPASCAQALRRALCLTREEKTAMRIMARKQAENAFNYKTYVEEMRRYLDDVIMC